MIVADMTGRNPNVFYEVGYAHALGKVVVLLTQNAQDIPFDLKHRQHTVYGGRIETLRKELTERLRWAIAESRRQSRGTTAERLSIRILDTDIPRTGVTDQLPTIGGKVRVRSFKLPLQMRNDSYETISGITHVYLFAEEGATVVPCRYVMRTLDFGLTQLAYQSQPIQYNVPESLDAFKASPIDAPDGLTNQFRLAMAVSNLPPGAVEPTSIDLMLLETSTKCDARFRLRLHSPSQFHEYSFRFAVEYEEEPLEKTGAPAKANPETDPSAAESEGSEKETSQISEQPDGTRVR